MSSGGYALLLACFFLSGVAGLVYETVWVEQFSFVYGAAELAVATVLAAYMGGLAVGAAAAGRLAHRVSRPVRVYAVLELGIAGSALAVAPAIGVVQILHAATFRSSDLAPPDAALSLAFYTVATFAVLMVPTCLMGATLPLLARQAVRRAEHIGPRMATLYAANAAGAAAGALLGAFVLLPRWPLATVVVAAAAINVLVAILAAGLERVGRSKTARGDVIAAAGRRPAAAKPAAVRAEDANGHDPATRRSGSPEVGSTGWILPLVLVSGAVALALEVLWTRLLSHLLGGSVYALGTMLAAFLVGIALGSALASRAALTFAAARAAFCWTQAGVAALSVLTLAGSRWLAELARWPGAGTYLLPTAVVAGLTLVPAALCMGAAFPLATRVLAGSAAATARASGRVFAFNTIGAILGAVTGGFVLLPSLRYAGTVALAAAASLAVAATAAMIARPRLRAPVAVCVGGLLMLALIPPRTPWEVLRSSPLGDREPFGDVVYYGVGRSATVLLQELGDVWRLTTNGLPESVILPHGAPPAPVAITKWMTLLPIAARPAARSLLVVGLGAGNTVLDAPRSLRTIDVVEIEPRVVEALRALPADRAPSPLADDRLRIHLNDARSALALTERRFDLIVSQPSHPWTSASSHLYTREFFELARERLTADGVFVQWMGLQFVDQALLRSLTATLLAVFPEVELYQPGLSGGVLFLASREPLLLDETVEEGLAVAAAGWRSVGVLTREDVLMYRALDSAGTIELAAGAPVNTDYLNHVKTGSPLALGDPLGAIGARSLFAAGLQASATRRGLDVFYVFRQLLARGALAPARSLVPRLSPPSLQRVALGLIELQAGRAAAAERLFWQAAGADPGSIAPLFGLYRVHRDDIVAGVEPLGIAARLALDPAGNAVVAAERALLRGDWRAAQESEADLTLDPRHPLFDIAESLRARWRVESEDPAHAGEAIAILAPWVGGRGAGSETQLLRARAGLAAGDLDVTLASLWSLARGRPSDEADERNASRTRRLDQAVVEEALALLEQADQAGVQAGAERVSRLRERLRGDQ